MAFVAGTKVLTEKGWKNIEDVGGVDRVLIRNFLGDAQFEKPFAVKRRDYSGKVIVGGSKNYKFRVTPKHEIVYTDKARKVLKTTAEEVVGKRGTYLKHKSRFSPETDLVTQKIRVNGRYYTVNTSDWYKFVGYVLRRARISKKAKRLVLMLDKKDPQKDMDLICPVLDRMRLEWGFTKPNFIVVSQKSNIGQKLSTTLGSRARKGMYIPDKMIYKAGIEDGSALIEMFIKACRSSGKGVGITTQFNTSNKKLIESLQTLGFLSGYTVSYILSKPAGAKVPAGVTKRDLYAVYIRKSVNEVSITTKKEIDYEGKVYEIDMFQDQLLIKEDGCSPIWMKPK